MLALFSLLMFVGLAAAPLQCQRASLQCQKVLLRSHLPWQAVAKAAVAVPRRTLVLLPIADGCRVSQHPLELVLAAAYFFVAVSALEEAQLVKVASAGFTLSICPVLFYS